MKIFCSQFNYNVMQNESIFILIVMWPSSKQDWLTVFEV